MTQVIDGALFALGATLAALLTAATAALVYTAGRRIRYSRPGWWLWRRRWPSHPRRW